MDPGAGMILLGSSLALHLLVLLSPLLASWVGRLFPSASTTVALYIPSKATTIFLFPMLICTMTLTFLPLRGGSRSALHESGQSCGFRDQVGKDSAAISLFSGTLSSGALS